MYLSIVYHIISHHTICCCIRLVWIRLNDSILYDLLIRLLHLGDTAAARRASASEAAKSPTWLYYHIVDYIRVVLFYVYSIVYHSTVYHSIVYYSIVYYSIL